MRLSAGFLARLLSSASAIATRRLRRLKILAPGSLPSKPDSPARFAERLPVPAARPPALEADALAVLDHELRTPLNAVIGFAGLLRSLGEESDVAARSQAYAAIIEAGGEHILAVLEATLRQSRAPAGPEALPRTAGTAFAQTSDQFIDLNALLSQCAVLLAPVAAARAITVAVETPRQVLATMGKPHAVRQIVINLIANAIKFSPPGAEIRVCLATRPDERLEISVTDRGLGIEVNELAATGRPYRRGSQALERGIAGSGLGLAICRSLAAGLGGTLELESRPGAGTRARLLLVAAKAAAPCPDSHSGAAHRPARSGTTVNPILAIGAP